MSISLAIAGATGKMGKKILSLALQDHGFSLAGGCSRKDSPLIGEDLGNILQRGHIGISLKKELAECLDQADLIIDFSSPYATLDHLDAALKWGKPFLIGSTGHVAETHLALEKASSQIPILFSPNFSFGMALCMQMANHLLKHLKGRGTIDIIETHHSSKKDTPSGTALALAKALGSESPPSGQRSSEGVAIHSIRSADIIGEHRVLFGWEGERLELKHEALSRDAFAKGALLAAKFLIKQPPGLYSLKDMDFFPIE